MTTLRYPDISGHQAPPEQAAPIRLDGAQAVCVKATEGTTYTNPWYAHWKAEAAAKHVFQFAYHMLHHGNTAAQAAHCFAVVGKGTGLMVDVEATPGSEPGIADEAAFVDAYRKLGGTVWLDYLPHWYWQHLGSPSMRVLTDRGLLLVSSAYTTYTDADTGTGWQPYGGRTPVVWQYTNSQPWNGQKVDFNAYRGPLTDFRSLALTGKLPATSGAVRHVVLAGNTQTWHQLAQSRGTTDAALAEVTRANLNPENLAFFDAFMAWNDALHKRGLPGAAMPAGMIWWSVNP